MNGMTAALLSVFHPTMGLTVASSMKESIAIICRLVSAALTWPCYFIQEIVKVILYYLVLRICTSLFLRYFFTMWPLLSASAWLLVL